VRGAVALQVVAAQAAQPDGSGLERVDGDRALALRQGELSRVEAHLQGARGFGGDAFRDRAPGDEIANLTALEPQAHIVVSGAAGGGSHIALDDGVAAVLEASTDARAAGNRRTSVRG